MAGGEGKGKNRGEVSPVSLQSLIHSGPFTYCDPSPSYSPFIQVIRYQKQLQQNYILMYRRNRDLERVMRELSVELESRDADDYEVRSGSNDIHFEEITATEI